MTRDAFVQVRLPRSKREVWAAAAAARGVTLTALLERAVDEELALGRALARQAARERKA